MIKIKTRTINSIAEVVVSKLKGTSLNASVENNAEDMEEHASTVNFTTDSTTRQLDNSTTY